MKVIIATENIYNPHGDLIALKYHYEDGSTSERKIFILASKLKKSNQPNNS